MHEAPGIKYHGFADASVMLATIISRRQEACAIKDDGGRSCIAFCIQPKHHQLFNKQGKPWRVVPVFCTPFQNWQLRTLYAYTLMNLVIMLVQACSAE